jgi:hypothetical protein
MVFFKNIFTNNFPILRFVSRDGLREERSVLSERLRSEVTVLFGILFSMILVHNYLFSHTLNS